MVTGAAGFPTVFAVSIREGAARQRAIPRSKITDGFIFHHFTWFQRVVEATTNG
jgi:hypothetical protein